MIVYCTLWVISGPRNSATARVAVSASRREEGYKLKFSDFMEEIENWGKIPVRD